MSSEVMAMLQRQGSRAKAAAAELAALCTDTKNEALNHMADRLEAERDSIVRANAIDLEQGAANGLTSALLERLTLNDGRIAGMAQSLREIAALPDPIGEIVYSSRRPNGLDIYKVRSPIGVIGIIYESRPNVTADAAGLCLKAGNAVILRGGEEALNSNRAISSIIIGAAREKGVPEGAIQLIDSPDRGAVIGLMKMNEYLDLLIPRGGKGLKQVVQANATVPLVMTGMGNCHIYLDEFADFDKAMAITMNAKVQRPSVCNAAETLLVHAAAADRLLPPIAQALAAAGVELRGCERCRALVPSMLEATEEDWDTEYLELIMAVKTVDSLEGAIGHIRRYGTGHSEAIVSEHYGNVQEFLRRIDAAAVYANASTRFTDGGEFGLGAEMGISTQKLHARGPMGLAELTSARYIIYGQGQVR
ncbi:MAG: glutamate-5-semialdehyde dehydrogenase [Syntrophomonadaceae bacterium]|nr:glutamate-5-semialdehyde dehydrogenase [Syntrophomonadaceae bacterium]